MESDRGNRAEMDGKALGRAGAGRCRHRRGHCKFFGTLRHFLSYSDKRTPWAENGPIFCVELSTCWC